MNADQLQQLAGFIVALGSAVGGNGLIRGRQVQKQTDSHGALQGEIKGLREDLAQTRDKIIRLEVRIEATEQADNAMSSKLEQAQAEMHALAGRLDAATEPITEILQMVKAAKDRAAQVTETPGNPNDVQDQTKVTIEKEKKHG